MTGKVPYGYGLFLAIFPDAIAAQQIGEHQTSLRRKLGLRGKPRPLDHLHVTIQHFGNYAEIPSPLIADATQSFGPALANVPSFDVTFDHAMSFNNRSGNYPFVMVNPKGNTALFALYKSLFRSSKFVPHVTLLYDKQLVSEQEVSPVSWAVKEVFLVLSHLGATKYDRLAQWPVNSPGLIQPSLFD